ncbi:MAG: PAS domain S-box protein [Mariprofundaceae bacterium]
MSRQNPHAPDAAAILQALAPIAASNMALKEKLAAMLDTLTSLPSLSIEKRAAVFIRDGDALRLAAHYHFQPDLAERCQRIESGECLCGKALETGQAVLSTHVDRAHSIHTEDMADHGHFNLPLVHAGTVVGILTLYLGAGVLPDAAERDRIKAAAELFALVLALHREEWRQRIREHEHRNALDLALDGILSLDDRGVIRYANRAAHRILGWRPGELTGQPMDVLLPEEMRGRHAGLFAQDIASADPRFLGKGSLVVPARRKDGERILIEISASPLEEETRRITAVFRDVSAREERNAQLARMRAALEATPAPLFICDPEGRIVDCNPAFLDLFGSDLAEVLGRPAWRMLAAKTDENEIACPLERLNDGEAWRGEITLPDPAGGTRRLLQTIAPVRDDAGQVRWHVSVLKDLTEPFRERERMEQVQRLESLGVLAGGIAHDFNNILAAIMGNASLARRKLGAAHEAARYLERIESASRSAADLCQQMMAYAGKGSEEVKRSDLNQIVRDMSELLRVSLHKSVALDLDLAPGLPALDLARGQIRQVIMNLITNANDAIGPEQTGRIMLRTSELTLDADESGFAGGEPPPAGRYVSLVVEDSGCGMSEETLTRIFEPFFTTKFTGRGLGLSALLGIVRKHGGALRVASEKDRGSRFEVLLPVPETEAPQAEQPAPEAPQARRDACRRVLIVDDEAFIRDIVCEVLGEAGFDTLSASSGEEALAIWREQGDTIALVLLDVTMPGMDGITCMREILARDPDAAIALCSGYSVNAIEDHVGPGMAWASIPKPFDPSELVRRVRELTADA